MAGRRKFDKLEYNENYNATHGEPIEIGRGDHENDFPKDNKETPKPMSSKIGSMLGMDATNVPEKINLPTRFTYSKTKRTASEEKKEPTEVASPPKAPFVLMICVMFLVFMAQRFVETITFEGCSESKTALVDVLINAVIYFLPILVYVFSSSERKKNYYVKGFSGSTLSFAITMLFFVICLTALQKYFLAYTYGYGVEMDVASKNIFLVLLTGAVVPAVFEQIFVHGVFQFEVSKYAGGFCGVTLSALLFALLQFDLNYFLIFFFIGIVMGSITHVTRSVFPAMIVRFISCTISILFSDRIMFIAVERIGGTLLMIILAALCFTFLIASLRVAERISVKRALESVKRFRELQVPLQSESDEEKTEEDIDVNPKKRVKKEDEASNIFFTANDGATFAKIGKATLSPFTLGAIAVFVIELLLKKS